VTPSELIQRAAVTLYGDRPQVAMARDLGVTTRTVYRWLHGHPTPSPKIFATLLARLHTRLDELDSLGSAIKEYLESPGMSHTANRPKPTRHEPQSTASGR